MKELINNCQDKKGVWRRARDALVIAGILGALTACERQSQITEGTVYQKEHTKTYQAPTGRILLQRLEIDKEVVSMPPTHEERGESLEWISRFLTLRYDEQWKVYVAQCPKDELPPQDKIVKECKTASFDVPQEVYRALKTGQYADFKESK